MVGGYSPDYPDHVWRWHKDVNGVRITTTDAEEAFRVEVCVHSEGENTQPYERESVKRGDKYVWTTLREDTGT